MAKLTTSARIDIEDDALIHIRIRY